MTPKPGKAVALLAIFAFLVWVGNAAVAVGEREEFAFDEPVDLGFLWAEMFRTPISEVFAVFNSPLIFPGTFFFMAVLVVTTVAFVYSQNTVSKWLFAIGYLASVPLGLLSLPLLGFTAFALDGETIEEGWPPLQSFGLIWLIATVIAVKSILRARALRQADAIAPATAPASV